MTLRFIDSFDDRDGDYLEEKWYINTNWIQAGGRNGTTCMDIPHAAHKVLDDQTTWIVGFALYYHTNGIASFMSFWDNLSQYQLSISTLGGGFLRVSYGAGIPIIGDTSAPLLFDQWQYVEVKIVIDDTVGSIDIRFDELNVFSASGIDTDVTDVGSVCEIVFPDITNNDFIDDVYICDGNGTMNNDFLGDCHIEAILPNGVGTPATAEWLNSDDDTASLYTMVNDNPVDWRRNYNLGAALPVKDVWSFPNIVVESSSILGIQVNTLARVEDYDHAVSIHNICRSGGIDYISVSYIVRDDYLYFSSIWERNPDGPTDWLTVDFNLAEFGYVREDLPGDTETRVNQLSVEILRGGSEEPSAPVLPPLQLQSEHTPGRRVAIGSLFRNLGVSVQVFDPLIRGGSYIGDITYKLQGYQHEKASVGGYLSMSITLIDNVSSLEEWFENGIGRHIVTYNPGGIPVMEAFVNQITFNIGAMSEQRGPLMGIGNTVRAIYSPKDSTLYPPTIGAQTTTVLVQDAVSVAKYGAVEKAISVGSCTLVEAEQARDSFLNEYKDPESTGGLNLSSMNMPNIVLDCLGYVKWTDVYVCSSVVPGYSSLSDKLKAILAAEYNSLFSTDYSNIATNAFLTGTSDSGEQYASTIIKAILTIGDANDNRYLFGCYKDRVFKYKQIPSTIKYHHYLSDPGQKIYEHDNPVDPWDVEPGHWVFVPDFLTGRVIQDTSLRKDPRNKFIESVTYTAPNTIDLSGGKTDPLSQFLAKLGGGY
jgi:hypothetical protein